MVLSIGSCEAGLVMEFHCEKICFCCLLLCSVISTSGKNSKTCLKRSFKNRQNNGLKDEW